jgi:V/A-type H+/Na+-transporting ATPase subunit D
MSAAIRWRLLELTRQIDAVQRGIALLDQKREALLREIVQRGDARVKQRTHLRERYARARVALADALVATGGPSAVSAGLAQPDPVQLTYLPRPFMGIRLPRFGPTFGTFNVHYGPAGTSAALDAASRAYASLLPFIIELAEEESAGRNLRRALARTGRTVNALKRAVLPQLEDERRTIAAALEEEDRDEAIRRRAWSAASASAERDRRPGERVTSEGTRRSRAAPESTRCISPARES